MTGNSLRRCLRNHLAGQPPLPTLDAAAVVLGEAHRLGGSLYHMGARVGHEDGARLRGIWAAQAAAHLRRVAVLRSVWPPDAPPPLVFKGGDLVENIYRDPGARRMSDLDLLLAPTDHAAVLARLTPLADATTLPRGERFAHEPPYEVALRFGDVTLELHRSPQPPHRGGPDAAGLLARSVAGSLDGLAVRYPHPLDRVLLWLVNMAKGSFHGDLSDYFDLASALQALSKPTPWTHLADRAATSGLSRPWRLACRQLATSEIWPGVLPEMGRWDDALAAALLPPLDVPPVHTPSWRFQGLKLWLADPPRRTGMIARALAGRRT